MTKTNQILGISQFCPKLCMQVEDYTIKFPKFQVPKLCGSWDIYTEKCANFGGPICYLYIPNIPNDKWSSSAFD